jgi:regulatory associated protein of mTOR
VTSIQSGDPSSNTFIAGFADGMLKVFDRRFEEEDSIVRVYSDHKTWIQNVCVHPNVRDQYISAR